MYEKQNSSCFWLIDIYPPILIKILTIRSHVVTCSSAWHIVLLVTYWTHLVERLGYWSLGEHLAERHGYWYFGDQLFSLGRTRWLLVHLWPLGYLGSVMDTGLPLTDCSHLVRRLRHCSNGDQLNSIGLLVERFGYLSLGDHLVTWFSVMDIGLLGDQLFSLGQARWLLGSWWPLGQLVKRHGYWCL